jgi:hypothetical protein
MARENSRINLIITTPHLADMDAAELARRMKADGLDVPVVLLAWDTRELSDFQARKDTSAIERTFLWQGDARTLVSIVKSVEDWRNAEHDTGAVGVQVIILVEDNVRYYSSFLPVMYTELLHHSQRVIVEGLNLSQKILRMRARPKILLCTTWEEAERAFERYADEVLGIISDVEFPRAGEKVPAGGGRLRAPGAGGLARTCRSCCTPRAPRTRPSPERGGRLPAQGVAAAPAGAARRDARALRLRRLRLPPAGRDRGGPRRRPAGPRGGARHGAEESLVHHAGPQPLLALAQGAHRVRPRPRAAAADARRLREPAGPAREPHRGDRLVPARAGPHPGHGLRPRRLRPLRRLLPDGRGLAGRQGAGPRLREAAARPAGPARPLRRRRDRGARLGGARHRRLRPLPRRQRPAPLRDRVRGRRARSSAGSGPPPSRRRRARRGRVPRAGHLAPRRPLLEPARGLAAPAVHRGLRHADAGRTTPGASASGSSGRSSRSSGSTPRPSRSTRRPTSGRRPTAWRRRRWR